MRRQLQKLRWEVMRGRFKVIAVGIERKKCVPERFLSLVDTPSEDYRRPVGDIE